MRATISAIAITLSAAAFAGSGIFGTKLSPTPAVQHDPTPIGFMPALQMFVALAIVLIAIKWLLPMLLKKVSGGFSNQRGSQIRVSESTVVNGATLSVIEVRGRTLLIGSTQSHISCLADLDPKATAQNLTTFHEMFEKEAGVSPTVAIDENPLNGLSAQLDRLKSLGL